MIDTTKYTRNEIRSILKLLWHQKEAAIKSYKELANAYYSEDTIYKEEEIEKKEED